MPDGWGYFVVYGRVTMIEISVDLPNVSVDQVHLTPQQGPSSMAWKTNGQLETLVLGKRGSNQTKIYDGGRRGLPMARSGRARRQRVSSASCDFSQVCP